MRIIFLFIFVVSAIHVHSQNNMPPHLEGKMTYPAIDGYPWIGVIAHENNALPYNPDVEYKVMMDMYDKVNDPASLYSPVSETARTYNLLVAHGVPEEKIKMAVIVHGGAVDAFLSNESYQEKFRQDNPNLDLIAKLYEKGVRFYACSQTMGFRNIENSEICKELDVAISAKTSMIQLDQLGYSYLDVGGN